MRKKIESTYVFGYYPTVLMVEYSVSFWLFKCRLIKAVEICNETNSDEIKNIANDIVYGKQLHRCTA